MKKIDKIKEVKFKWVKEDYNSYPNPNNPNKQLRTWVIRQRLANTVAKLAQKKY